MVAYMLTNSNSKCHTRSFGFLSWAIFFTGWWTHSLQLHSFNIIFHIWCHRCVKARTSASSSGSSSALYGTSGAKCCWWVADVTIAVVVAVIVLVCKGQLLRRKKSKYSQGGKVEKSGSLLAVINHQCLLNNLFFWLVFLSFNWLYVSLGYHCDWKTWTHELDTQFHKKVDYDSWCAYVLLYKVVQRYWWSVFGFAMTLYAITIPMTDYDG